MKKYLVSITLMLVVSLSATAQVGYDLREWGYDIYQYSRNNRQHMSARVSAMGGAFTSLGADPSSIAINPAGLGLYKNGEISFTPSIRINNVENQSGAYVNNLGKTDYSNGLTTNTTSTKFSLNNFNAIFIAGQNDYKLVRNITFGLGYNINAVNTVISNSAAPASTTSIVDYYANMLTGSGVTPSSITATDADPFAPYLDNATGLWGAISSFNNGLVSHNSVTNSYETDKIGLDDEFSTRLGKNFKGTNESFDFSMAVNFSDYVSVGITMGVASYNMVTYNNYFEDAELTNTGIYDTMSQYEQIRTSGVAFDLRLGAVVEPIEGLRIGAAYHMPRTTRILESYLIDQSVTYYEVTTPIVPCKESAIAESEYKITSPHKLLAGASYVIRGIGIVSVDYERVWYNGMKLDGSGVLDPTLPQIGEIYKPTDAIYVGLEAYLGYNIFLRGGFNYVTSPFVDSERLDGYDDSSMSFTAGIGYKAKSFYVDASYVYSGTKHLQYEYYYSFDAPVARNKVDSHIIAITVGWRF